MTIRSLPSPSSRLAAICCLVASVAVAWISAEASSGQADRPVLPPGIAIGLMLDGEPPPALVEKEPTPSPEIAIPVRLTADWAEIELREGVFDWSGLRPVVSGLSTRGHPVVLCLTGSNPLYLEAGAAPSPLAGSSMDRWLAFVRSAVRSFAGQVSVYEIWDGPADGDPAVYEPGVYAFVLKQSALAVRAEARIAGVEVAVAQGALDHRALAWQRQLWRNDTAAYVDVLPVRFVIDMEQTDPTSALSGVVSSALENPPAPAVWAYVERSEGAPAYAALSGAVTALAGGATVALAEPPPSRGSEGADWALGVQRALSSGFGAAPRGELQLVDLEGRAIPGARVLGRFLSDEDFTSLIVYDASPVADEMEQAFLIVDGRRARNGRTVDPVAARELRTAAVEREGEPSRRSFRVPVRGYPMLLVYERAVVSPGFELPPEKLEVESVRGLTAEEIIARYQQVQKIQDDALDRWMARGRIDYHVKLAQGGSTVDISIGSNYFWERGGQLEWEQTEYYVNGNRVGWKNIPEIPLVQPEKVITLPLDLTLDKTYVYRLVGEGGVGGRDAYVLAFEPVDPDAPRSLYRGRVWIDKEGFQRLKVSLVQGRMDPPVLANEERDMFHPHEGPDGRTYWMLSETEGQQVWNAAGRNLVVRREVTFETFEINPPLPEFESRRAEAYASNHQMLRDTDEGFRYLERQGDGTRKVKHSVKSNQLFLAAGAFQDSSRSLTPLAGVNWFDYDLGGRNVQMNVLFAGPLAFVTASKPDLFGGKIDATAEAALVGIKFDQKVFFADQESELERTEIRPQNVSLRLGIPAGKFFKVNLIGDLTHRDYFLTDRAETRLGELSGATFEYRLPPDNLETTATVELEFNRRGYTVGATASRSSRSDWDQFGLFDVAGGTFVRYTGGEVTDPASYVPFDPGPARDSFTKWKLTTFKEWYLPKFQKLRGEINYLDGSDLDQFSRYEFSLFGDDRLNGFSGSGVRFDDGLIFRSGYSFNLFEVIRFDVSLETARVKQLEDPGGRQSFTGLGLSGNFIGPWKTLISLSYGVALDSEIPQLDGEDEFLLFVFKLF